MTFQNSLLTQLLSEAFVTALWPNQLSQSFVSPGRSLCMSVCQTGYKHVSGPCEVNSKLSTGLLNHVCKNMTETLIWHSYLALYLTFYLTFYLAFYLAFLSGILSGTLSDVGSAILIWHSSLAFFSGILTVRLAFHLAFLSGILIWHSYLAFYLALYLAFYLAYLLAFSPAVEVRQGTLGVDSRGWGPAGNTGRGFSRLRSGREHLAWMVAVEVRQGTLGVDGRGWGPAGNTWRGFSRLRSGREHLAWMVVVEVRRRRKAAEGGRRQEAAGGGGSQLT